MFNATVEGDWNGTEVKVKGKMVSQRSAFEIGLIVEAQAIALCPTDTGRLKGSLTTKAQNQGTRARAPAGAGDEIQPPADTMEVFVGTNVFYAPYVEFGTRYMQSQAFLRPALDMAMGRTLTIVKNAARLEWKDYLLDYDSVKGEYITK